MVWIQFLICLIVIGLAGYRLCLYGDMIAEKLGWSRSWIGIAMVASVTSLPELVSGISAVSMANSPDIAVGDVFGSCAFNLLLIVIIDFLHRQESVYTRARIGHALSAGFGVILIGFMASSLLMANQGMAPAVMNVGVYSPIVILLYALAMRTLFRYEQMQDLPVAHPDAPLYPNTTLKQAVYGYAFTATGIVIAGGWLPFVGQSLAETMGWSEGFVGTLFIAAVTSLPEAVVAIAAVRIGALDMALGNLFGSNLFNMVILAVDDFFYRPGPLLSSVSPSHAVSALSAMVMSGIAIVGLFYRPEQRILRTVGWISLMLLSVYLFNAFIVYQYDH